MFKRYFHAAGLSRQGLVTRESGGLLGRLLPAWNGRRAMGALEHLGSLSLTAHSSLALVRLHDETLLLGITPQNIRVLAKRPNDAHLGAAREEVAGR